MSQTASSPTQIVVREREGNWHLMWSGSDRVFANQGAAIAGAIEMAHANGKNGSPTCVVLVAGKSAKPRTIWTYGLDQHPALLRNHKSRAEASPA